MAAIVLLACSLLLLDYASWSRRTLARLAERSRVVQTSRGPMEFAESGSGARVLLILHGSPGGFDQAVIVADALGRMPGWRFLMPSRPGYLRTPISVGASPQEQADALAAFLEALDLDRVSLLAWSGSGPCALELARRHPGRIDGLILLSARIMGDDKYYFTNPEEDIVPFDPAHVVVDRSFFGPDLRSYLGVVSVRVLPDWILARFFPSGADNLGLTLTRLRRMQLTTVPASARVMGRRNDVWQFASLERAPELEIATPTLIVHSRADGSVAFAHAEYASAALPNARLVPLDRDTHFSTLNHRTVAAIRSFLEGRGTSPADGPDPAGLQSSKPRIPGS